MGSIEMEKRMTASQAKTAMGEAMCKVMGLPIERTKAGHLTVKTKRALNAAGYYWFPSERVWRRPGVTGGAVV